MTHDRPLNERVIGNLYYKTDLIIHARPIMDLERHVLTRNYRQERDREHALLRDAMFGREASASSIALRSPHIHTSAPVPTPLPPE